MTLSFVQPPVTPELYVQQSRPFAVSGVDVFSIREIKNEAFSESGQRKEIDTLKGHSLFLKPTLLPTPHSSFLVQLLLKHSLIWEEAWMRTGAKPRVCSLVREQNSPNTTSLHQQGERGRLCERLLEGLGGAEAFEFRHGHKWNSLTDVVNRLDEYTSEMQSTDQGCQR
ncbi:hypothetical protein QQF64_008006 [Cirrhinus molitorella]|uniref:Uncharacterized protein n=1 Tax=Cirrhinus molitorella TaxID=172907 RepID=A0ABR3M4X7_9TELE